MTETVVKPKTKVKVKTERPRLHKVILVNDDYTPREFVVSILKAEFRMSEDEAYKVMITAHRRGVCVVAVFTKDVAETKATRATDAGRAKGYPCCSLPNRKNSLRPPAARSCTQGFLQYLRSGSGSRPFVGQAIDALCPGKASNGELAEVAPIGAADTGKTFRCHDGAAKLPGDLFQSCGKIDRRPDAGEVKP